MNVTQYILAVIAALSVFVEFVPIKINPISSILKWIGKQINEDIKEQLQELQSKVDTLEMQEAQNEVDQIRNEILKFGKSCRNKEKHTQKQFEQIIYLYKKYEDLVEKYQIDNGVLEIEYDYILEIYKRCQREGAFL